MFDIGYRIVLRIKLFNTINHFVKDFSGFKLANEELNLCNNLVQHIYNTSNELLYV